MSDLYIEARLQAIKDIASASCVDIKDADNIASFCDEIYSAIPNIDRIVEKLEIIEQHCLDMSDWQGQSAICDAIEIVKAGAKNEID